MGLPPTPPKSTEDANDDNDGDSEGYLSSSESASESDDDYGKKKGAKGKPVAKRARTGKVGASAKRTGFSRKSVANLGGIIDMPLDVLFEIFGHVAPKDLLHLSRTSKILRNTLLSKRAITIWHASMRMMGAPPCPNDYSEPKWANLLFGGSNCQSCGARGVSRLDFSLRRRICVRCAKDMLVCQNRFQQKFPTYDPLIMDLVPYTNLGGWSSGSGSANKFFFPDDVHAIAKDFKKLDDDVKKGTPGAQQAFEGFLKLKIEVVVHSLITARTSSSWASDSAEKQREEKDERKSARLSAVKAKLLELGHLAKDMGGLTTLSAVNKDTELTDLSWARCRKAIEAHVEANRDKRLVREREPLIASRKRIIAKIYSNYKKTLVPTQWAYHPPVETLYKLDELAELIDDPSNSEIDIEVWTQALNRLPVIVESLNEEKKAILLSLLPAGDGQTACKTASLDLATAVFQCTAYTCTHKNKPFIGWQRAVCHSCNGGYGSRVLPSEPAYKFNNWAAYTVRVIGGLLGLDTTNANPRDFDLKAARFSCLSCQLSTVFGIRGRKALTWREAVAHSVELSSHAVKWQILSSEQTTEVKLREQNAIDPADNWPGWSCSHCAHFFEELGRFDQVTKHVKDLHAVNDPIEGRDLFFDQRFARPARSAFVVGDKVLPMATSTAAPVKASHNHKDYFCRKCLTKTERNRKFQLQGVLSHLSAKHKVSQPVLMNDYSLTPAS